MVSVSRVPALFGGAVLASVMAVGAAFAGNGIESGADPQIGEEVSSICFASSINAWRAVKGEDNVVLLKRSVNNWYRVELSGYCPERDLRFASTIGIDSRPGGGCVTRGDIILVTGANDFVRRCFIRKIYKWSDEPPPPAESGETDDGEDA